MTNLEKIQNMSAEELADKMYEHIICSFCPIYDRCAKIKQTVEESGNVEDFFCPKVFTEWLKSEVDEK